MKQNTRQLLFEYLDEILQVRFKDTELTECYDLAEMMLNQYERIEKDSNSFMACKWLDDRLHGTHIEEFMLPVIKYPKTGKKRQEMAFTRRDACIWAKAFCYGMSRILKLSDSEIDFVFCKLKQRYREAADV